MMPLRNPLCAVLAASALIVCAAPCFASKVYTVRTWTRLDGHTLSGRFEAMQGDDVVISASGARAVVPFAELSPADQAFLRQGLAGGTQALPAAAPAPTAAPAVATPTASTPSATATAPASAPTYQQRPASSSPAPSYQQAPSGASRPSSTVAAPPPAASPASSYSPSYASPAASSAPHTSVPPMTIPKYTHTPPAYTPPVVEVEEKTYYTEVTTGVGGVILSIALTVLQYLLKNDDD